MGDIFDVALGDSASEKEQEKAETKDIFDVAMSSKAKTDSADSSGGDIFDVALGNKSVIPTPKEQITVIPRENLEKISIDRERSFWGDHPNLAGAAGALKEVSKAIPFTKYLHEDERERFMQLDQQHQSRDILYQTLFAELFVGGNALTNNVKSVAAKYFPKTYERIAKIANTRIGGKIKNVKTGEVVTDKPMTVAQKIKAYKDANGSHPDKEQISQWWDDAFKEGGYKEPPKVVASGVGASERETPEYAASINLDRQLVEESVKDIEREAAKSVVKRVQTWDETGKISREILKDPVKTADVLSKMKSADGVTAAEMDAARQLNIDAVKQLHDLGQTLSPEDFNVAFNQYKENIFKVVSEASSEAGRLLNIHKRVVSPSRLGKAFSKIKGGLNERQLAEFKNLNFENPAEVKAFIERLADPAIKDYVYEFWYNGILSAPSTHLVNAISNTIWGTYQIPHRALEAGIDAVYTMVKPGRSRAAYLKEIIPMLSGFTRGLGRGAGEARRVMFGKTLSQMDSKWSLEMGSSIGAFERSPNKIVRGVGKFITPPSKALRAMDVLANAASYDAQMGALAVRAGLNKKLTGEALKSFIKNFVQKPPISAHNDAMEFARYATFMDKPSAVAEGLMRIRSGVPGTKLIVPFVRTIDRLLVRGMEMTPGVGFAVAKTQGKSMIAPDVVAKQIEGLVVSAAMWNKIAKGEVTGSAPQTKEERERFYAQGKLPWSIKVGNRWIQYRRIEPFNTIVASTYAAYENIINAPDEENIVERMLNAAVTMKDNLIDSSYLQGVSEIMNRSYSGENRKIKGIAQRTLASFVPYSSFFRSINRAIEAEFEGSAKVRDTNSFIGAFSQVLPFMYKLTEPRLDVLGKEIELEGGVFRQWLPYKWRTETNDIVEKTFEVLDVYPSLPQEKYTFRGQEKKFSDETYRNFVISYGNRAYQKMNEMVSSQYFQDVLKDETKHEHLKKRVNLVLGRIRDVERRRAISKDNQ
jgi:hypothetical protein